MARLFASASSQSMERLTGIAPGEPLTVSAWVKETTQVTGVIFWLGDKDVANERFQLYLGAGTGNKLAAFSQDAGASGESVTTVATTAGVWQHCAGVWASNTSRTAYLNGVAATANTTNVSPSNMDAVSLGYNKGAASAYLNATIAEVGVWNIALVLEELVALSKGVSPLLIRPTSLVAYWPLYGNDSPEPDRWRNAYALTLNNTPTKADHPRIYMPAGWVPTQYRPYAALAAQASIVFTGSAALSTTPALAATANVVFTARGHLELAPWLEPTPYISVDGVLRGTGRPVESENVLEDVTITQEMDHAANRCNFVAVGFEPRVGSRVIVVLGHIDNPDRLFAGSVINVTQLQRNESGLIRYAVNAIDDTWKLTFPRVIGKTYTFESATNIVLDLVNEYASWLDVSGVEAGLDSLDEISFENGTSLDSAFTQLAKRIGAYWDVTEHGGLLFGYALDPIEPAWLTPMSFEGVTPDALAVQRDGSQIVTRVIFECGGSAATGEIPVGETMIPVLSPTWYPPNGGEVVSGKNRITYTSVQGGGTGSLVGFGIGPAVAPTVTASSTPGSVNAGAHLYAYTFTTGSGESLPSPLATTVGSLPAPTDKPVLVHNGPNADQTTRIIGRTIRYKYTASTAATGSDTSAETTASPESVGILTTPSTTNPSKASSITVKLTNPTSPLITFLRVYTSIDGGPFYFTEAVVPSGTSGYTDFTDHNGDITGGAQPPAVNTATVTRFTIGIATSGSGSVTGRNIYRTEANLSQLKLLTSIADNTTTTFDDGLADASLGANAPTADTSGLSQSTGQVNAGAGTIPVAGAGWASANGGWAVVGNGDQIVRYTGVSGNTLTGVTGLTSSIAYNSSITAAPTLTGIPASGPGSITTLIPKGQDVNMLVTVNSTVGQAALRAGFGTGAFDANIFDPNIFDTEGQGGSGVIEEYVQDRRLTVEEATARAMAILALRELPQTSLRYQTRDRLTKAGRTVTVMLPAPTSVEGSYKIQRVTISGFLPHLHPLRQVEASNAKFSFEDLLRGARNANRAQNV